MNTETPYSNLDPNLILDAVESLGLRCTGGLLALNSYENRVYQIDIEDSAPFIAKFYRPNRWTDDAILEEHQFALELAQQDIPVIAPWVSQTSHTLHHYQDHRFALFPRRGGRGLELDRLDQLEWMGRFIGRMHAVGAVQPFKHRINLTVDTYGYKPYQFLLDHHFIPDHMLENYKMTVESILEKIQQQFLNIADLSVIRLHGDMHAGNVLWSDHGPHVVDLDDCLMGPAIQDIWMLLSGDKKQVEIQLQHILKSYQAFHDFDYRELHLIESLRTLRMLHYSGWLARRWEDPAFPLNFPWFNTAKYWQEQLANLREQNEMLS